MRILLRLGAVGAMAMLCSTSAFAQGNCDQSRLLWDNGLPDGSNGYSNIDPNCFMNMPCCL